MLSLQDRPELVWLHHIRTQQYNEAHSALRSLASIPARPLQAQKVRVKIIIIFNIKENRWYSDVFNAHMCSFLYKILSYPFWPATFDADQYCDRRISVWQSYRCSRLMRTMFHSLVRDWALCWDSIWWLSLFRYWLFAPRATFCIVSGAAIRPNSAAN